MVSEHFTKFDRCQRDQNQNGIKELLFRKFKTHYRSNKAPLIINIETDWLTSDSQKNSKLTDALVQFVAEITNGAQYRDVYFLTIDNIIKWIQFPRTVEESGRDWVWECSPALFGYNIFLNDNCMNAKERKKKAEMSEGELQRGSVLSNIKNMLELKVEQLFPNRVVPYISLFFCVCTLLLILNDKIVSGNEEEKIKGMLKQ